MLRRNPPRSCRHVSYPVSVPDDHIFVYQLDPAATDKDGNLKDLVDRANSSKACQVYCASIRAAGALYLQEAQEAGKGLGVRLVRPVLGGQTLSLCYYSGIISNNDNGGNHCLELGPWHGHTVYLDGAYRVPSTDQHSTSMQMVNHKCHDYCNSAANWKEFEDDAGGLGLLELMVTGPMAAGAFLSFDYIRRGGNFFRCGLHGIETPKGFRRICSVLLQLWP